MPYQSEVDAEFRFLHDLTGRTVPECGKEARLCQACGEVAEVPSLEHLIAALEYRGDFIAFWGEHKACRTRDGLLTGWRYCEICRTETAATPENRTGLNWICPDCRQGIRLAVRGEAGTLEGLAAWRGSRAGTHIGRFRKLPRNVPLADDIPVLISPPGGWTPIGLRECPECHWGTGFTFCAGANGSVTRRQSRCRCEIPRCRKCGDRSLLGYPTTSTYSPRRGQWIYTSAVLGPFAMKCGACLDEAGVKTLSYSEAKNKLSPDDQVRVAKTVDKWKVEDVNQRGDA